jgi:putative membrane protein
MKNQSIGQSTAPLGLVVLLAVVACEGSQRNVARDQSAAASAETSDTGAPGARGGAPAATPKGLSDSNIVAILDSADKADSAAGAAALKKATSAEVREFARLMMSEHHTMRAEGQQLAKQLGITGKAPERDPLAGYTRTEANELRKTPKGPEFDRTYIDHEVSVHQAVLDFVNQARVITQNPQLKQHIEKAIPLIRKHLEQAQAIQKKLAPAA